MPNGRGHDGPRTGPTEFEEAPQVNVDPAPQHPRRSRPRETTVGIGALALVIAVLVASTAFALRRARAAVPVASDMGLRERQAVERKKTEQALTVVSSLATAVDSLARLQAVSGGVPESMPEPPAATEWSSPTTCMLSYLPEVAVPVGGLDFVCEETDFWALDWKVRAHMSNRVGGGARLWNRLGPYSLAALASMRRGCCVDPPHLQAKVPGLWCGILRDTLRSVQPTPTPANVREFETMMKCLEGRGMRLPAHFDAVERERARDAFTEFVKIARRRTSPRGAPPIEAP